MNHPLETFRFCPRCGSDRWVINNIKSKHCCDCGFTFYANPSAATAAFIVRKRSDESCELLTVRRAKDPAKGTLDLPGGFVDMDETAEQGMLREIAEETGLAVTSCRYMFSIPNLYEYSGMTIHTLDMFYLCEPPVGAEPHAADDAAECFWIPVADVCPQDFGLRSIRRAVERFMANGMIAL